MCAGAWLFVWTDTNKPSCEARTLNGAFKFRKVARDAPRDLGVAPRESGVAPCDLGVAPRESGVASRGSVVASTFFVFIFFHFLVFWIAIT